MAPNIQYPWLNSNLEISYPFMPQVYPWYVASIFTDAYIVDGTNLRVNVAPIDEPLRLVQFEMPNAGTAGPIQLQYVSDGSLFFFDNTSPTTLYSVHDFGQWKVISADNAEERKFLRLTLYSPNIPSYPFELSAFVDGLEAVFVSRVHEQNLPKVYSIEVTDALTGVTHVLNEDVEIRPGYNTEFTVENQQITSRSFENSEQRLLTAVSMSAAAGGGEGRLPIDCEEEAEAVRQLNFLPPDAQGSLLVSLDGTMRSNFVYTGTGVLITREESVLSLDNDGAACCTCDEYGEAYNDVLSLQARAKVAAESAHYVNDQNCEIARGLIDSILCREVLEIKVVLVARSSWLVNVMVIFNNNPTCDRNAPPVNITIASAAGSYSLVPGSAYVYNRLVDSGWRKVTIASPENPGVTAEVVAGNDYMVLSYELLFNNKGTRACDQLVTVTASGVWDTTPVTASDTTELICPLRDPDPSDCEEVTDYPPEP